MHLKAGTKHLKVTINCVMQRWRVNLHCVLRNGKGSFGSTIFGGHFHSPGTRRISSATLKQRVVNENFFSPSEVFKLKKCRSVRVSDERTKTPCKFLSPCFLWWMKSETRQVPAEKYVWYGTFCRSDMKSHAANQFITHFLLWTAPLPSDALEMCSQGVSN